MYNHSSIRTKRLRHECLAKVILSSYTCLPNAIDTLVYSDLVL